MRRTAKRVGDIAIVLGALALSGACAETQTPRELVDARAAYQRLQARDDAADRFDRSEMRAAKVALDIAEASYLDDPGGQKTRDLAYVAQRKAQMAEGNGANSDEPLQVRPDAANAAHR